MSFEGLLWFLHDLKRLIPSLYCPRVWISPQSGFAWSGSLGHWGDSGLRPASDGPKRGPLHLQGKLHNSLTDQQTKHPVHIQMFLTRTQKIKRSKVNLRELLGSTSLHAGAGRDVYRTTVRLTDLNTCALKPERSVRFAFIRLTVSLLPQGVLYVGTSEGVTAVPVANCSTYTTCSQCLLARDPLCGWSRASRACARVHGGHEDM